MATAPGSTLRRSTRSASTRRPPDPIPGGHYYQRDPDGTPTGWLVESQAFFPHLAGLGAFDAASAARPSNLVYAVFSSVGVTTVYDAGMSAFEVPALEAVAEMDRAGILRFRVVASHQIQHPNQVPGAIERFAELSRLYDGDRLHMGMIKIHNDGTTEARTAAYLEPYTDVPQSSGAVLLEPSILNPFVVAADRAGIDIHIHALGDGAVRQALDAIELARAANPGADTRHTLAHVEQITDVDVPRFAALNVTAQTTPYWCSTDYQLHMEHMVGSIEVGKRADLVVLGSNIFELPLHEIHNARVDVTMVDGVLVVGTLP